MTDTSATNETGAASTGKPCLVLSELVPPTPGAPNALEYVVVRNSFDVQTDVYITYSLAEAIEQRDVMEKETDMSWRIAVTIK